MMDAVKKGVSGSSESGAATQAAASAETKFCQECGKSIPKNSKFCPECGKPQG
jgi:rRNA maturation endonuclease Nob1